MRRAYVGLSGPLAYDYKNQFDRVDARDGSSPNPLLEDSLGLMVLYDEIVFLSPQLCPHNMRELPFVKFLNSRPDFAPKFQRVLERAQQRHEDQGEIDRNFRSPFDKFRPAVQTMTGQRYYMAARDELRFITDNHTHTFFVAPDMGVVGNSARFHNVLVDWITREVFELGDCDLISNSAASVYYEALSLEVPNPISPAAVAHRLVVRRLPNYLEESGPYHPCMEELRNHEYIVDARKYLTELVQSGTSRDVDEASVRITNVAQEMRKRFFRKHLEKSNEYFVVGKVGASELAGVFIPGVGALQELIAERNAEKEKSQLRWAGFVCDLQDFGDESAG
jgi:hypothetical protein